MANIGVDSILQLTGSLGTFGVVIWLYVQAQKSIKEKDGNIKNLNDKLLDAFETNASVNQSLNDTIKENTKVTHTLTERVTDVLINRRQN